MIIFLLTIIISFICIHYLFLKFMRKETKNIVTAHIASFPFSFIASVFISMVAYMGIFNTIVNHSEKYTTYKEHYILDAINVDDLAYYEMNAENKIFKINNEFVIKNGVIFDEKTPKENIIYTRETYLKNEKLQKILKYEKTEEVYKVSSNKILLADKK